MSLLYRKESEEVFYPIDEIVSVEKSNLNELKKLALLNPRKRIRFCAHKSPSNHLHEMFIIHARDCYVRPHKHIGKVESMAILEGEVDVVLFNEEGAIRKVIKMGEVNSGKKFYYRMSEPIYHTLLIRSDFLVFHEITEGPFEREKTIFPNWAPKENEHEVSNFISKIEMLIKEM